MMGLVTATKRTETFHKVLIVEVLVEKARNLEHRL